MQLGNSFQERIKKSFMPLTVMVFSVLVGYYITHAIFAAAPVAKGISISTDQLQYNVGQNVIVTLSNTNSQNAYVKNNCPDVPLAVYRLQGGKWVGLHKLASVTKCQGEPSSYKIPAGRSIKTDYSYWPDLFSQPGEYKIVANIENYSNGPTAEFQVISQ
jgi:hypothetical protein